MAASGQVRSNRNELCRTEQVDRDRYEVPLYSIHEDIKSLIASLNTFMDTRGWKQVWENFPVNDELGGKLPKVWVARTIWLYYIPKDSSKDQVDRLVMCACHLTPPASSIHDYATILVTAPHLRERLSLDAIDENWSTDSEAGALQVTLGVSGPVLLPPEVSKAMFPAASSAIACGCRLGDLKDAQAVSDFLSPILDTESSYVGLRFPHSPYPREELERRRREARAHPELGKSLAEVLAHLEQLGGRTV